MKVRNTVTGAVGVVRGAWRNQSGQVVVNVRVGTVMESWNAARVVVIETEKAA